MRLRFSFAPDCRRRPPTRWPRHPPPRRSCRARVRNPSRVAAKGSEASPPRRKRAQRSTRSAVKREPNTEPSSSGAWTIRFRIWSPTWERNRRAEVKATRNTPIDSTIPLWVFGTTLASPLSTARAATSASAVSDLPRCRRAWRLGRITSITSMPRSARWREGPAPYAPVPSTPTLRISPKGAIQARSLPASVPRPPGVVSRPDARLPGAHAARADGVLPFWRHPGISAATASASWSAPGRSHCAGTFGHSQDCEHQDVACARASWRTCNRYFISPSVPSQKSGQ